MLKFILFLIPHFWIHEAGHYFMANLFDRELKFYYNEAKLWNFTVPQYKWRMPLGLTKIKKILIALAGFGLEFVVGILLLKYFPSVFSSLYMAGAFFHAAIYRLYNENGGDFQWI